MIKPRTALLVGSSFSAAPILFALKKYGLHVSVCGKHEKDPCHEIADASYFIDYSDASKLEELVGSGKFDFLIPSCNDSSYMSCARFAEKFGFPGFDGFETASILHTKNKFRALTETLRIPAPRYAALSQRDVFDAPALSFPLLVKPVDSFSGRGMSRVSTGDELELAVKLARDCSPTSEVIVEEFVEGTLHSHSAFLFDGRIAFDFFVDEFCTSYPYQVNCSNHPSVLDEVLRNQVRKAICVIAKSVDLADGLIHTQFLAKGSQVWIIETMRRCPGDLYGSLVTKSTGVNYADLFVRSFIAEPLPPSLEASCELPFGRHTISSDKLIAAFSFSQSIPATEVDVVPLKISGHTLHPAPYDKMAILFAHFESYEKMKVFTPRMKDFVEIKAL